MESARYLLYLVAISLAFLVLAVIKWAQPPPKPAPYDPVGMELYQLLFFDTFSAKQLTEEYSQEQTNDFVDDQYASKKEEILPDKALNNFEDASLDDRAYFEAFIKNYNETVLTKRKYRNDVVVRYYRHEPDGIGAQRLVDYGFYVHERPVTNKNRYKNNSSNVIYYGHEFPERDLKLIAYVLIQNGIEIKRIQPFKDFDGWKRKSVEIGSSSSLQNAKVLSLAKLRTFKAAN